MSLANRLSLLAGRKTTRPNPLIIAMSSSVNGVSGKADDSGGGFVWA